MKIIFSSYDETQNPYYGGGGSIIINEITKRLTKKYSIKIICGAYYNCIDETRNGIEYKHIGLRNVGPLFGQIIFSLLLPIYVLKEKYDFWVETFTPPHSTNFLQAFTRKPVIGLTMMLDAKKFSLKYKLPFHWIENLGLKQYKYIIVLNNELREKILSISPNARVELIPGGIDDNLFRIHSNEGQFALFIGRIDIYQKGLDLLLQSWKNILDKDIKIKLIIVGSGTKKDERIMHELIKKYKLSNIVEFKGRIFGAEKQKLLSHCLFSVAPSRFETFGLSALEVLALGKTLVCFNIEGFKWIPNKYAIKIKSFDTNEYSKKILDVFNNKLLRHTLVNEKKAFAKEHTWDKLALKYDKFFDSIYEKKI